MPFFPPLFGYLSSHCLSACWERRRTTCTEDVLWVYCDPSVIWAVLFPEDSLAQRLYQHPGPFLTSHPCEAYQGAGGQTCRKHIFQHLPSFSAVSYVLGYQYRPFFFSLVCCFFYSSHTHTHTFIPIPSRPAVVFLLLQLHTYLRHGVLGPCFHRPSLQLGKGLLGLVRLWQQQSRFRAAGLTMQLCCSDVARSPARSLWHSIRGRSSSGSLWEVRGCWNPGEQQWSLSLGVTTRLTTEDLK